MRFLNVNTFPSARGWSGSPAKPPKVVGIAKIWSPVVVVWSEKRREFPRVFVQVRKATGLLTVPSWEGVLSNLIPAIASEN